MNITAEKILENRNWIHDCINKYISSPRKEKLLAFYEKFDERLTMMPASYKKEFHNAFEGGYYDHVRRVIELSLDTFSLWKKYGVDTSGFTEEELVFSALNHDLGKMGDEENTAYIPQTDKWRQEKLGEDYMFNDNIPFASVPDRGLFLLQSHGVTYTFNEMLAIQTHDGLYDPANDKYLKGWKAETKFRNALPLILHQADVTAARIEFEKEWLPVFNKNSGTKDAKVSSTPTASKPKENSITTKKRKITETNNKALKATKSQGLMDLLDKM